MPISEERRRKFFKLLPQVCNVDGVAYFDRADDALTELVEEIEQQSRRRPQGCPAGEVAGDPGGVEVLPAAGLETVKVWRCEPRVIRCQRINEELRTVFTVQFPGLPDAFEFSVADELHFRGEGPLIKPGRRQGNEPSRPVVRCADKLSSRQRRQLEGAFKRIARLGLPVMSCPVDAGRIK